MKKSEMGIKPYFISATGTRTKDFTLIVAIHQPQYLPWLGYFHKLITADAFCFLDNVQYKKNEWQNRNRIKTAAGWQWLTVPVGYRFGQAVSEVTINNTVDWQKKHLHALQTNFSRAPFYEEVIAVLSDGFARKWDLLADPGCRYKRRRIPGHHRRQCHF